MSILKATAEANAQPDKPDLFEPLETHWHFPCGMCIHRDTPETEHCRGCRYYFN